MSMYTTEIVAVDPKTGTLKKWGGPNVPGETEQEAREYCDNNGLGYVNILGRTIGGAYMDEDLIDNLNEDT